jgi:cytosine/uracil/thiamine/allantoin permease
MNRTISTALFLVLAMSLSSCEAIEAIFKAGVWVGVLVVVAVIALIIWIISRVGRK